METIVQWQARHDDSAVQHSARRTGSMTATMGKNGPSHTRKSGLYDSTHWYLAHSHQHHYHEKGISVVFNALPIREQPVTSTSAPTLNKMSFTRSCSPAANRAPFVWAYTVFASSIDMSATEFPSPGIVAGPGILLSSRHFHAAYAQNAAYNAAAETDTHSSHIASLQIASSG